MFEAKLGSGLVFKKVIEAIKDLVKNVNIDANQTGMSMQAMDSSHVALVSLTLQEDGFEKYRCDKQITLGLSIENLSKILKLAGTDDIITLKTESDQPSSLQLEFEGKKQEKFSKFNLNLLNLDSEQLGIPDTNYSSVVTMSTGEFSRICKDLAAISETVLIETTKQSVSFSVKGEIGDGKITINHNEGETEEEKTILDVDEPVSLSFALRYLNLFNKASTLSNQVTLSLSQETPLVVEYKMDKLGSLKFYLAPKINDEENQ